MKSAVILVTLSCLGKTLFAAPPPPPDAGTLSDWSNSFAPNAPGLLAADALLDPPAGRRGPIVVREGHFYSGDQRVRFWGMNLAFGANFPTHDQADAIANRLAHFGINAVRLHHMDNQPFPSGIFADRTLTTLSADALDRVDYFMAALKSHGIWCDLNLHVSRSYNQSHPETQNNKTPIDKLVDLFDPVLIESQRHYAHDLLDHVNAYTHNRYADEPSIAIVEINNENSLFMWDAREKLADLPAPFAGELKGQWNQWLLKRYPSREDLQKAWSIGAESIGRQMLLDGELSMPEGHSPWFNEMHETARLTVTRTDGTAILNVTHVDAIPWHAQFMQAHLSVIAGRPYTVRFDAQSEKPVKIEVTVGETHDPWSNLGLAESVMLTPNQKTYTLTFVATQSDENARLSFTVGYADSTIRLTRPFIAIGGVDGLRDGEDTGAGTVAMPGVLPSGTRARRADWFTFLEEKEANYYRGMLDYLHHDLGVKCPVTGTIAFGLLPLQAQLGMDFIDAHAYWDHPQFPHRPWDPADWAIQNKPMVDALRGNALFSLAGYRVAGKPFTVTEYNHAAPNEWQAECVPMIASYAAAQDWDAVFLFAYSHSADFEKPMMKDFFNFEGNPLKMPLVAMGARLFLGSGIQPLSTRAAKLVRLDAASGAQQSPADASSLSAQACVTYDAGWAKVANFSAATPKIAWSSSGVGSGTGQYTVVDPHAVVFVGFISEKLPIDLGIMSIRSMSTPFATLVLTAADGKQTLAEANRLLLTTVARAQNTDMKWNATRSSVGISWGKEPEQLERVVTTLRLQGHWSHCHALDVNGNPIGDDLARFVDDATELVLGNVAAQAYVIDR